MGRNGFPGSPLFCRFGRQLNGLVGMLSNYNSGNDIGNELSMTV